jgi:gamma-glutamyltranspeptidase/glutathione hydrolase
LLAPAIVAAQRRTSDSFTGVGAAGVGRMTLADLAAYRPKIRAPIVGNYRGWTIASMSPPSSGGLTIVQMLEMMERFPLGDASQGFGFGAKNTLHVMIEAMRLAYSDRAWWMGDAEFVCVPEVGLLAAPYVASRSALIHLDSVMASVAPGNPLPYDPVCGGAQAAMAAEPHEGVHTTHLAVVDRWGNIVTWTTTIESAWGTGIMVPGYGFLLNNELTDFNFPSTFNAATGNPGANDVAPGKRPRSSMSPTILLKDGEPFAAYGSPGGATIINTVLQITLNLLDHGMTIQDAIDAPRIHSGASGVVSCEVGPLFPMGFTPTPAFSPAVLDALRAMGHTVQQCTNASQGSVQGVIIDLRNGKQFGGADPRRQGTVISILGGH